MLSVIFHSKFLFILQDIGFKPFTNAQIYKPNICSRPDNCKNLKGIDRVEGGTSIYFLIASEDQKNQDGGYNCPLKALCLLYIYKMRQDRKTLDAFELWCWMRLLKAEWTAKKT